ncbi:MAG: bifunctional 2-polyprenyl-6-hydroxyphenol methylase/3-demethylubiquinol 3-O-methyltransferase UbiG [Nevskiales bacterium]
MSAPRSQINVDDAELKKFSDLAAHWWDLGGELKPLHQMNPIRLRYVDQRCGGLKGKRALDVGCGGGILTEALARTGAQALGIDLAEAALEAGRQHAVQQKVQVEYRAVAVEALAREQPASFDLITCMEMLEHVPDPASVVQACAELVKPGGQVFFSTISRTPKAYALAIIAAEYILNLVPRGTHDYAKFIRPSELDAWAGAAGLETLDVSGLHYNPLLQHFRIGGDAGGVNYLMHCIKSASQ